MDLYKLGWNEYFEREFVKSENRSVKPARVVSRLRNRYVVCSEDGYVKGELSGKFRHQAVANRDYPVVGDWVAISMVKEENKAIIKEVLPRRTFFARKLPISGGRKIKNDKIVGGLIEEQVIASNIDTVFIVSGLDNNFNLQRIERYITLVYNSGATPVIILNKMDLCSNVEDYVCKVNSVALGIEVQTVSAEKNVNMEAFNSYMMPGNTVVFLGSSGVGKSTIINSLFGECRQRTNEVSSSHGKGRHTTTSSELFLHESGCIMIDTPGLRELQLWGEEEVLEDSFEDIAQIAKSCKFKDCRHVGEPGCAVAEAIENGTITGERFEGYMKQLEELQGLSKMRREFERNFNRRAKIKGLNNC